MIVSVLRRAKELATLAAPLAATRMHLATDASDSRADCLITSDDRLIASRARRLDLIRNNGLQH